jgi:aldehyde dehydrogenase (NAD+)
MTPYPAAQLLSPAAAAFLTESPMRLLIGGRLECSSGATLLENVDPGTGTPICTAPRGDAVDVDRAVSVAHAAFRSGPWANATPDQRAASLLRLADLVQDNLRPIAELECLDVGKPLSQGLADVRHFIQTVRFYAKVADGLPMSERLDAPGFVVSRNSRPCGVCAVVLPWNYPLVLFGWNVIPAIAAGNTVVVKSSEQAFLTPLYVSRLANQCLPAGVLNILTGTGMEAGAPLVRHSEVRRVSFTGSISVGREIASACARNIVPVKLELGGKGAAIVFEDANLEDAVASLARALTTNAGQVCFTATRWVVRRAVFEEFLEKITRKLAATRIGYWSAATSRMGPLISQAQRLRVLEHQHHAIAGGAEARLLGGLAEVEGFAGGYYVKPAVLVGTSGNFAEQTEIFGPVGYATVFDDDDEAAQIANGTTYGLANSVWTADENRARRIARALESGTCWLNCQNVLLPGVPFSGMKRSGMGGGVLSLESVRDYLLMQSVIGLSGQG